MRKKPDFCEEVSISKEIHIQLLFIFLRKKNQTDRQTGSTEIANK